MDIGDEDRGIDVEALREESQRNERTAWRTERRDRRSHSVDGVKREAKEGKNGALQRGRVKKYRQTLRNSWST